MKLKKRTEFEWTTKCNNAFQSLKIILATPPILTQPSPGEVLYLYLEVFKEDMSVVLIREVNGGQHLVFFVLKALAGAETKYQQN